MNAVLLVSCLIPILTEGFILNYKRDQAFQKLPKCLEQDIGKMWPDYSDKSAYYECSGLNILHKRYCPSSLVFDYYQQVCTWDFLWNSVPAPAGLNSQNVIVNDFISTTTNTPKPDPCEICWKPKCETLSDLGELWPDYDNKRFYYECQSVGVTKRRPCGDHTVFVFERQMCLWEREWIPPPPKEIFSDFSFS